MLEIKNVSFSAQGRKILDDINLVIPEGKLICLTGPNGGGKTTLAKMIAGVEKPDKGQILLDGMDLVPLDPTERARAGVGYAFQQPVRFKGITVRDILNMAAGRTLSDEELANVLREVGLDAGEYVDRGVGNHLSGGEIKRIEIATVLLRHSKVSVFDEPEAGIDLWSFNSLVRVFENIRDKRESSLVIISHQERILSIADEIVMIQNGKVGLRGDRHTIFPRLLCKNDNCDPGCPRNTRD
ncbi:MAG: ATP-binding cassette domain-containing protein [Clostridia bacterium]|nr:ATP-binding cassette domain-containing protein [Clostridia bacterium]